MVHLCFMIVRKSKKRKLTGINYRGCSKMPTIFTKKTPLCRSGVFFVNFGHILHFLIVFSLLTLTR